MHGEGAYRQYNPLLTQYTKNCAELQCNPTQFRNPIETIYRGNQSSNAFSAPGVGREV